MDAPHISQTAQDMLQCAPAGIHGYAPARMPLREIAVFRQLQTKKAAYVRPPFHAPCILHPPLKRKRHVERPLPAMAEQRGNG